MVEDQTLLFGSCLIPFHAAAPKLGILLICGFRSWNQLISNIYLCVMWVMKGSWRLQAGKHLSSSVGVGAVLSLHFERRLILRTAENVFVHNVSSLFTLLCERCQLDWAVRKNTDDKTLCWRGSCHQFTIQGQEDKLFMADLLCKISDLCKQCACASLFRLFGCVSCHIKDLAKHVAS